MFTASIETNFGQFDYGFHLGSTEWIARDLCRELMHLERDPKNRKIHVVSVGLKLRGKLIDTYDGDWFSELDMQAHEFDYDMSF